MKVFFRGWLVVLALCLAACASVPPVAVDYDPTADFSGLRSYYLLDPLATGQVSPLEIKRARQAADDMLRLRFQPADSAESADFLVRVRLHSAEKIAVYEDRLALYGGYHHWGWGWRAPLEVRHYRETWLTLDILSPDNAPLWHASTPSTAARYAYPEQRLQRLREEAATLLNRFPPR